MRPACMHVHRVPPRIQRMELNRTARLVSWLLCLQAENFNFRDARETTAVAMEE